MNHDPELPIKFANTVLEELAFLRGELLAQRKLLIALSSRLSKEPRRKIKERAYQQMVTGRFDAGRDLKQRAGLTPKKETP